MWNLAMWDPLKCLLKHILIAQHIFVQPLIDVVDYYALHPEGKPL